jgi:hypothetical protein
MMNLRAVLLVGSPWLRTLDVGSVELLSALGHAVWRLAPGSQVCDRSRSLEYWTLWLTKEAQLVAKVCLCFWLWLSLWVTLASASEKSRIRTLLETEDCLKFRLGSRGLKYPLGAPSLRFAPQSIVTTLWYHSLGLNHKPQPKHCTSASCRHLAALQ